MADLGTLLITGDPTNQSTDWDTYTAGDYINLDEGITGADGTEEGDDSNANGDVYGYFTITDVPADLTSMTTLNVNVRYRVTGAQTNYRGLHIRVETDEATPTALTSELTIVAGTEGDHITNTTLTNSGATGMTISGTPTEAQWNNAVVRVRVNITKNKGGDTNGFRMDTLEFTGTYDNTPVLNPGIATLTWVANDVTSEVQATIFPSWPQPAPNSLSWNRDKATPKADNLLRRCVFLSRFDSQQPFNALHPDFHNGSGSKGGTQSIEFAPFGQVLKLASSGGGHEQRIQFEPNQRTYFDTDKVTMALWFRTTSFLTSGTVNLFYTPTQNDVKFYSETTGITWDVYNSAGTQSSSTLTFPAYQWVLAIGRFDSGGSGQMDVEIWSADGKLIDSYSATKATGTINSNATGDIAVGLSNSQVSEFAQGAIWDDVLTDEQVYELVQNPWVVWEQRNPAEDLLNWRQYAPESRAADAWLAPDSAVIDPLRIKPEYRSLLAGLEFYAPWFVGGDMENMPLYTQNGVYYPSSVTGIKRDPTISYAGMGVDNGGAVNARIAYDYLPTTTGSDNRTTMVVGWTIGEDHLGVANQHLLSYGTESLGQAWHVRIQDDGYPGLFTAGTTRNVKFEDNILRADRPYCYIVKLDGTDITDVKGFINGYEMTGGTYGTGTLNTTNSSTMSFFGRNDTEVPFETGCHLVMHWNRALSDEEIRILSDDPFALFRQQPHFAVINPAAGGGTSVDPGIATLPWVANDVTADPGPVSVYPSGLRVVDKALAFYRLGEATGTGDRVDSHNSYDLTPTGSVTQVAGHIGNAVQPNAETIQNTSFPGFYRKATIAFWHYQSADDNTVRRQLKWVNDTTQAQVSLNVRHDAADYTPQILLRTPGGQQSVTSAITLSFSTWYFHVVEVDLGKTKNSFHVTHRVYNTSGAQVGSTGEVDNAGVDGSTTFAELNEFQLIGYSAVTQAFDSVFVSRELLSEGEIQWLLNEGTGRDYSALSGQVPLINRMSAFWPLDDDGTWADAMGKQASFTESGTVTTTTGKHGSAADFSGTAGDYLQIAAAANSDFAHIREGPWSVVFWVKADTLTPTYSEAVNLGGGSNPDEGWRVSIRDTGAVYFMVSDGVSTRKLVNTGASSLTTGNWFLVVCTYEGSGAANSMKIRLYNSSGAQAGSTGQTTDFGSTAIKADQPFYVGGDDGGDELDGQIDSLAIFPGYLLTDGEIQLLLDGGAGYDYVDFFDPPSIEWVSNDATVESGLQANPAIATLPWVAQDTTATPGAATSSPAIASLPWVAQDVTTTPGGVVTSPAIASLPWAAQDIAQIDVATAPGIASLLWVAQDTTATPGTATASPGIASLAWVAQDATVEGVTVVDPGIATLPWVAQDIAAIDVTVPVGIASLPWVAQDVLTLADVAPGIAALPWVAQNVLTSADVAPGISTLPWVAQDVTTTPGGATASPAIATLPWVAQDTVSSSGTQVSPGIASLPWVAQNTTATPGAATASPAISSLPWVAQDVLTSADVAPAIAALPWVAQDIAQVDITVAPGIASLAWVAQNATTTPGAATASPAIASLVWVAQNALTEGAVEPAIASLPWVAQDVTTVAGGVTASPAIASLPWVAQDIAQIDVAAAPGIASLPWVAQDTTATPGAATASPDIASLAWVAQNALTEGGVLPGIASLNWVAQDVIADADVAPGAATLPWVAQDVLTTAEVAVGIAQITWSSADVQSVSEANVFPGVATITWAAQDVTVEFGPRPGIATLTWVAQSPTTNQEAFTTPAVITWVAQDPRPGGEVSPTAAAISWTSQGVSVDTNVLVDPDIATLVWSSQDPTLDASAYPAQAVLAWTAVDVEAELPINIIGYVTVDRFFGPVIVNKDTHVIVDRP